MGDGARLAGRFAILVALAGLAGLLVGVRPQLDVHQVAAGGSAQVAPQDAWALWPPHRVHTPVAAGERRVRMRLPALLPARLAYDASDQPGPAEVRSVAVRVLGLPLGGRLAFEPPVVPDQMASGSFERDFAMPPAQPATFTLVHLPWWVRAWMLWPMAVLAAACAVAYAAHARSLARDATPADGIDQTRLALLFLAACYGIMVYQAVWLGPWQPMWDDWRYLIPGAFSLVDGDFDWLGMAGNDTYFLTGQVLDWMVLHASGGSFLAIRLVALALLGAFLVFAAHLALHLPRQQAVLALVALAFVLGPDGYWTLQAIAYHQFLPVLFLMIAIAVLQRAWQHPDRLETGATLALVACALLAGLAYISGAVLFIAFAIATAAGLGGSRARAGYRRVLPVLVLFAVALAAGVVQVAMVSQFQDSLLERTHASATVFPDNWRFWAFQLGLVARAFQFRTSLPNWEVFVAVLVLAAGLALLVRAWRSEGADRYLTAIGTGLVAAAVAYACVVAAGRAGLADPPSPWIKVVEMGAARFHFWWLAALLPVPLAMAAGLLPGFRRWGRLVVPVAALAMVVVKVDAVLEHDSKGFRLTGRQEAQGIACVRASYERPGPLLCTDFYPTDLRAPVEAARQRDLRLWRSLMQVP